MLNTEQLKLIEQAVKEHGGIMTNCTPSEYRVRALNKVITNYNKLIQEINDVPLAKRDIKVLDEMIETRNQYIIMANELRKYDKEY